jgi:hypothetical protein
MEPCVFIEKCPFLRRFWQDPVYEHLIRDYCYGTLQSGCRIKKNFDQTGQPPPENWSPVGQLLDRFGKS